MIIVTRQKVVKSHKVNWRNLLEYLKKYKHLREIISLKCLYFLATIIVAKDRRIYFLPTSHHYKAVMLLQIQICMIHLIASMLVFRI